MSQIQDAVQAVSDFVAQSLIDHAELPKSDAQFLSADCFRNLLQLARPISAAERNDVLTALAPAIFAATDDLQASRAAMMCGILVEWGADPTIAIDAILKRLRIQLIAAAEVAGRINDDTEAILFANSPDAVKAWKGLRFMVLPAMTMLCANVDARMQARRNAGLMEGVRLLAQTHRDVTFLQQLFSLADGEELIVLHPPENKGFRVRLEAVRTNFHLFSLLQDVLVGDPIQGYLIGPPANRKVIATATGAVPHDRLVTDTALWHYATWAGLGSLAPVTFLKGEETPTEIPLFEGDRLILLGAPNLGGVRSWDSSFFTNLHNALRSKVEVVEVLTAGEVEARLRRIRHIEEPGTK